MRQTSAQKHFRGRIGEAQPLLGELKAVAGGSSPAANFELLQLGPPFAAQVKLGRPLKLVKGPAGIHAQTERGHFTRAAQGR